MTILTIDAGRHTVAIAPNEDNTLFRATITPMIAGGDATSVSAAVQSLATRLEAIAAELRAWRP